MYRWLGTMGLLAGALAAAPAAAQDDASITPEDTADEAETEGSQGDSAEESDSEDSEVESPEEVETEASEGDSVEASEGDSVEASEDDSVEASEGDSVEESGAARAAEVPDSMPPPPPSPESKEDVDGLEESDSTKGSEGLRLRLPAPPSLAFLGPAPLTLKPTEGVELTLTARAQFRAVVFDGDDPENNDPVVYGDPGLREGVSVRRSRIGVAGRVADCFSFAIEGGWDNRYDATLPLIEGFQLVEAALGFQPLSAIGVYGGVVRVPYGREAMASSSTLLMHERSMASEHMGKGREPGVAVGGALGPENNAVLGPRAFRWDFGVFNGASDWFGDVDPQPRLAGRVRLDLGGEWDDRESAWSLPEIALASVGGSAAYNRGLDANTISLGADVGVRVWRFSLQGELLWSSAEPAFDTEGIPTLQEPRESLGWYGRLGLAIFPEYLELGFRVDAYNDNRAVEDAGDRMDIAVGLNTNPFKGRLRLQLHYIHRMELTDGHNTSNDSVVLQVAGRL